MERHTVEEAKANECRTQRRERERCAVYIGVGVWGHQVSDCRALGPETGV